MVAQTFVSIHLYGYGTVLATIQNIFTTDGCRPRSTTRFYNGFGVYVFGSMYMTTESMKVQPCTRYEGQLNHMAESTPPPPPSGPFPRITTLIITPQRTDGLKRTGYIDWRGRLLRTILTLFEAKGVLNDAVLIWS